MCQNNHVNSVSINCAHLHPQYGELSPEEQLEAMKLEEEAGEVDLNLQAYKKRRNEARRSPYPSVIVEVMSTPPPEYTSPRMTYIREEGEEQITNEDIARLNALLSLNAASTKKDGDFYDALGEVSGSDVNAMYVCAMHENNSYFRDAFLPGIC